VIIPAAGLSDCMGTEKAILNYNINTPDDYARFLEETSLYPKKM
jgi:hypothetical protein